MYVCTSGCMGQAVTPQIMISSISKIVLSVIATGFIKYNYIELRAVSTTEKKLTRQFLHCKN